MRELFLIFLFSSLLFSKTIVVDDDYVETCFPFIGCLVIVDTCENGDYKTKTISDALSNANNGDIIKICPGEYDESQLKIDVNDLNITSTTTNRNDVKIVSDSTNYVFFTSSWHSGISFNHLTIEQSKKKDAIYIDSGENWEFNDINITSTQKGGIYIKEYFSRLNIKNSLIDSKGQSIAFNNGGNNLFVSDSNISSQREAIKISGYFSGVNINHTLINSQKEGVYFFDSSENIFINNSNISSKRDNIFFAKDANIQNLKIKDSNISSSRTNVSVWGKVNGSLEINNSVFKSEKKSVYIRSSINKISIIDSNITSANDIGLYVYDAVNDDVNFTNVNIDANSSYGIYFRENINGDSFVIEKAKINSKKDSLYFKKDVNAKLLISNSEFNSTDYNGINFKGVINKGGEFIDINIIADDRGIYFNKDISKDINISNVKIVTNNYSFIRVRGKVNNNFYVNNSDLNSSSGYGIKFDNDVYGDLSIYENNISSKKDALYFKRSINNIILKNNCIYTDDYVFNFKDDVYNYKITNNCFSNGAYSKDTLINTNKNYWDSIIGGKNVVDNNPLSSCPLGCFKTKLVANWQMDECEWNGDEGEVKDYSGNENNGTAKNHANTSEEAKLCRSGNFDASNSQYIRVPASNSLTISNKLSYVTWIKLKDPNYVGNDDKLENIFTNQYWANALRYTEKGYYNNGNKENRILFQLKFEGDSEPIYCFSDKKIDDTDWHFVAATFDGKDMKIYIDGALNKTCHVGNKNIETKNADNIIGGEYDNYYFNGYIDELKVFKGALSKTQIDNIYNNEKSGKNWDGSNRVCNVCESENLNYLFDAFDTDKNLSDRNITTKIVNNEFNLTLVALDENGSELKEFNGTVCARVVSTDGYQGDWNKTLWNNEKEKNITFSINKAIKNARINIEWKVSEDTDCPIEDANETNSSDNFAIRPKEFDANNLSKLIAGEDFNLTIKALDKIDNLAKDYNESIYIKGDSVSIEYVDSKNCIDGNLNKVSGGNFADGEGNITLNYKEVGELNVTIKEVNGSEFAIVDADDTPDKDRFIKEKNITLSFIPYEFKVESNLSNFDNFTYLDDNLTIYAKDDVNISSLNAKGDVTLNYNIKCYAKDIFVKIKLSDIDDNLTKLYLKYKDINGSEVLLESNKNDYIEFNISRDNFTTDNNGSALLKFKINFDRNASKAINLFDFNISEFNVSDEDVSKSEAVLDGNASMYYGRVICEDLHVEGDEVNETCKVLFYDEKKEHQKEILYNWWQNMLHSIKDGNITIDEIKVTQEYEANSSEVNVSVENISIENGEIKITLKRNDSDVDFAVIHLLGKNLRWLWYSMYDENYNISDNSSCKNHYCFTITFENSTTDSSQKVYSGDVNGTESNITDVKTGVKIFR
jgi:hypothetical protein